MKWICETSFDEFIHFSDCRQFCWMRSLQIRWIQWSIYNKEKKNSQSVINTINTQVLLGKCITNLLFFTFKYGGKFHQMYVSIAFFDDSREYTSIFVCFSSLRTEMWTMYTVALVFHNNTIRRDVRIGVFAANSLRAKTLSWAIFVEFVFVIFILFQEMVVSILRAVWVSIWQKEISESFSEL